jgi:hypothetical protein
MIAILQAELGRTATKRFLPMQPGDVVETFADIDDLERDTGLPSEMSLKGRVESVCALGPRLLPPLTTYSTRWLMSRHRLRE